MDLVSHKRNPDDTYGPTSRGDYYISKEDHRRTAKKKEEKTLWRIKEGQEFSVFKISNEPKNWWFCEENNCLFSLIKNCSFILGSTGERIAKFPNDRNAKEPWHGYPVLTERNENRPSSELLDVIQNQGAITYSVRIKIERGQI